MLPGLLGFTSHSDTTLVHDVNDLLMYIAFHLTVCSLRSNQGYSLLSPLPGSRKRKMHFCFNPINSRFTEKYDITLSDMAKAELRGHFKEAVLAWVDAAADPTKGVELVCTTQGYYCS